MGDVPQLGRLPPKMRHRYTWQRTHIQQTELASALSSIYSPEHHCIVEILSFPALLRMATCELQPLHSVVFLRVPTHPCYVKPVSKFKFRVLGNVRLREECHLISTEEIGPPHFHPEAGPEHRWAEVGFPPRPGLSAAEHSTYSGS